MLHFVASYVVFCSQLCCILQLTSLLYLFFYSFLFSKNTSFSFGLDTKCSVAIFLLFRIDTKCSALYFFYSKIIGFMFRLQFPLFDKNSKIFFLLFSCIMSNVMMLVLVREVTPPYPASEERADYCQIICQYITRPSILCSRCLERRASPYQKSTC